MKETLIDAARIRELFSYDSETGIFTWRVSLSRRAPIGAEAGAPNVAGYINVGIEGHDYYAHRLAWLYVHGEWPPFQMDHINGDRSDNRISNLRRATNQQNAANKKRPRVDNKSGHSGVHFDKSRQKWLVTVGHKYIGRFASKDGAIAARTAAAKAAFGDFFVS